MIALDLGHRSLPLPMPRATAASLDRSPSAEPARPAWSVIWQRAIAPSPDVTHITDSIATTAIVGSAPTPIGDDDLLAAIQQGDPEALALLYDRYGRQCFAVAYRVLDDGGGAEDAVQDAFLAVWRQARSFRPERGAVRTWLLAIVRNAAVDRRRGRHARPLGDIPLADVESRLATDEDETFATVEASLLQIRLQSALATLPAEQRRAIELAFFHGLTHQEIAERTGLPLGTVKGRLRLGLRKLRTLLAPEMPGLAVECDGDYV